MAVVLGTFPRFLKFIFIEFQDPLTKDFPLIDSPIPILMIVAFYNYFVLSLGPKLMANRKPYNLPRLMMIYNLFQIFSNLYVLIMGSIYVLFNPDFSLICQPLSYADTPTRRKLASVGYIYFLIKITDLLDTVFFVLRKKNKHVSFLHVYHHSGMVMLTYAFNKYLTGSHGTLLGVLNAFVHITMYSYYFMTLFKHELTNSLWWKKYITQLQIIQFAILVVHISIPIIMGNCDYPLAFLFVGAIQNIFMFALFTDFYIKTYVKNKPKAE